MPSSSPTRAVVFVFPLSSAPMEPALKKARVDNVQSLCSLDGVTLSTSDLYGLSRMARRRSS